MAAALRIGEHRWYRSHGERARTGDLAGTLDPLPYVSVVVAARDEAGVVPLLLADLGRQDHRLPDGRPQFDVVLIDDRSSDGTGRAAAEAADGAGVGSITRIVRRSGTQLADGKGAALAAAPPDELAGEVVVVLDADARVARDFLRAIATEMTGGAPGLSVPIRVPGRSRLERAQAAEQRLDGSIQRARYALGGLSEFRGNGIVIRRSVLVEAGGWHHALTEDLDLSSRLAVLGHRIDVSRSASVAAEAVGNLPALWTQRLRWAEGALRRLFEHGPAVLGSDRLSTRARADFAIYAGHLALPGLVVGAGIGAMRHRRPGAVTGMLATWGVALTVLGGGPDAALLSGLWIAAVPAAALRLAFRRGPVRYAKMEHHGPGSEPGYREHRT
jgi:cellulose synthase/poly-beta-1,6-N-acetylglucosamine synthase-like glycosyltransferase